MVIGSTYRLGGLIGPASSLTELRRLGHLADCGLKCRDGVLVPAHKVILASASKYFFAMFLGAGAQLGASEGVANSGCGTSASTTTTHCNLPDYYSHEVEDLLDALYADTVALHCGNLAHMLSLGSYLGIAPLVAACCQVGAAAQPQQTAPPLVLLHLCCLPTASSNFDSNRKSRF